MRHDWLLHALELHRIPPQIVRVIAALYSRNRAIFRWRSSKVMVMSIERGLRQGCPTSGVLWAIAFNPLLVRLKQILGGVQHSVTCFMGDLAIALARVLRDGGPAVAFLFSLGVICGLEVHLDKT